jgi:lysophospholipase L1-like esterase
MPSRSCALALSFVLAALVLAMLPGCEDERLVRPDDAGQDGLFARYVALGNSITAGYQSGGIYAQTQQASYAVDLAGKMGTDFDLPLLSAPGCPPPLTQIFPSRQRLGGPDAPECALRTADAPRTLNNVAVPNAAVIDATSNLSPASNANPLTTFILGGRTQVEAALDADPTFASVWIGNNDVLGAALAGDARLVTGVDSFRTRYTRLLDRLDAGADDLQGALLFAVADVTALPVLSPGAAYAQAVPQAQQAGDDVPPNFEVAASCAPSADGRRLVPFQYGATLLQVAARLFQQSGADASPITLDCAQDRTVREAIGAAFGGVSEIPILIDEAISGTAGISLLTQAEIGPLARAVEAYNDVIRAQAEERGYAFYNPNDLFEKNEGDLPTFPELIDDPANDFSPEQPFGPLFSLDGVHPSARTHGLIAEEAAAAINDTYDEAGLPVGGSEN